MNAEQLWQLSGWTMVHFLWIGTAIALVTAIVRVPLRQAAPAIRYGAMLVCFLSLSAAPLVIAAWLATSTASWTSPPTSASPSLPTSLFPPAVSQADRSETVTVIDLADTPVVVDSMMDASIVDASLDAPTLDSQTPALPATQLVDSMTAGSSGRLDFAIVLDRVTRWLPWIWVVGAPLTFLLLASGLVGVERLRRSSEPITTDLAYDVCERLRGSLRVGQRVSVAVSERVVQPILLGIIRPLILLPPAAVTGWSPAQLEMALMHELAHVRRWDNLVNLFQRLVESILFFHPAIWLVSRWLRADREQCCDATVVRHTETPEAYADLLIAIAAQSHGFALPLASSPLARHSLTRRVRRLLQLEDDPMLVSRCTLGAASLAIAAVLALVLWQPVTKTVAQESVDESGEVVASDSEPTQGEEDTDEKTAGQVVAKPDSPSPFMSLDDQRIADLAYKLLHVEIAPLDKQILPAVKAEGYSGGVLVESTVPRDRRVVFEPGLEVGDILVGLHVWPTANFEQVAEVLRRDDLMEFSPLKYFVLRRSPKPPSPIEEGGDAFEMGRDGWYGDEMGGEEAYGNFEMGSGRHRGRNTTRGGAPQPDSQGKLWLVTGRIPVPAEEWAAEQQRLQQAEKTDGHARGQDLRGGGGAQIVEPGRMVPPLPVASLQEGRRVPSIFPPEPLQDRSRGGNTSIRPEQLRYDGRTFDEWRIQWKTELKIEKRTEAIKALAAFGRAGYGKEAVEELLDLAGEYDFRIIDGGSREPTLQGVFLGEFVDRFDTGTVIPSKLWLSAVADRYKGDPDRYRWIVVHLINGVRDVDKEGREQLLTWSTSSDPELRAAALIGLINTDTKREQASTIEALHRNLTDPELSVRNAALYRLGGWGKYPAPETNPRYLDRLMPDLLTNLFFEDDGVQQSARFALTYFDKQALQPIAKKLFEVLDEPPASATFLADKTYADLSQEELTNARLAAIRALTAGRLFGPTNQEMLLQLIQKHPYELGVAAGIAFNVSKNRTWEDEPGRVQVAAAQLEAEAGSSKPTDQQIQQRAQSLLGPFRVEASKLPSIGGFGGGSGLGGGGFSGGGFSGGR